MDKPFPPPLTPDPTQPSAPIPGIPGPATWASPPTWESQGAPPANMTPISMMPQGSVPNGSEWVPVLQGGINVKLSLAQAVSLTLLPQCRMEAVTVLGPNQAAPLSGIPNGGFCALIINGYAFLPVGPNPPFMLNGQSIIWLSTTYGFNVGDTVSCAYSFGALGLPGQGANPGVVSWNGRSGVVTLTGSDITTAGGILEAPSDGSTYGRVNASWGKVLPISGGTLTGTVYGPHGGFDLLTASDGASPPSLVNSPAPSDNTAKVATTAWARAVFLPLGGGTITGGTIFSTTAPVQFQAAALAVTPAPGDNSTKLATTAYVQGQASSTTPAMDGTAAVGVGTTWARADHVHPSDTSRAPIASPTFTGTVTIPSGASIAGYAPLASPALSGNPSAPTQASGTNNTTLATTAYVDQHGWGRNRIINGAMRIDQWNNGTLITPTSGQYICDRFLVGISATGKFTTQQIDVNTGNLPAGFPAQAALKIVSASAYTSLTSDFFGISQRIEGYNFNDLRWGSSLAAPIVLQFEAQASISGTFSGSLMNANSTRAYPFNFALTANTPALVTIAIPGDTTGTWIVAENLTAHQVFFDLGTGSTYRGTAGAWASGNFFGATGATSLLATNGATLWISNVKLEKGLVATPFEEEDIMTALAKCQRYYERSYDLGVATGTANAMGAQLVFTGPFASGTLTGGAQIQFKAPKRADPAVTMYSEVTGASGKVRDGSNAADVTPTLWNVGTTCASWYATTSLATTNINLQAHWTANAEL